jgi:hypothetical protein
MGELVAPLRQKGVFLDTVSEGTIEWNSFAGRLGYVVKAKASEGEQREKSRRVLSTMMRLAESGAPTGGRALYGYKVEYRTEVRRGREVNVPVRYVPDGRKAEVVQLIFRLCAKGRTLNQIADELYRAGVESPAGAARWSRPTLRGILRKRKYVGDWV